MSEKYADPPRIFESGAAPRELRQWLTEASDDALTAAQIEQLVSSFEQRIHTCGMGVSDARPFQVEGLKAWLKTSASKLGLVAVVVGLGAAGTIGAIRHRNQRAVQFASSALPSDTVSNGVGLAPTSERADRGSNDVPPQQQPSGGTALGVRQGERPNPPPASAASVARHGGAVQLVASARADSSADSGSDSADEYRLLRAARQAAASDAARALSLADEHLRRFPHGMLSQERETIAIESLARLGNRTAAQQRADRFLNTFPTSPYAARIRAAVAR
jgi:hypothetical protein